MTEAVLGSDAFYDAGDEGCAGPALRDIASILSDLESGGALEVRSTDDTGRENLRAFCRLRGFAIESEYAGPDRDRILIRKP